MKTVLLNRFDGGIANDPRAEGNVCRVVSNFDILTNPHRLAPYHDSESADSVASTRQAQNFAIALRTGTTYAMYALGVVSGTARAEISYKDLADVPTMTGFSSPANHQSASGTTSFNLFTYYRKTNLIYGAKAGTTIWAFSPSGSAFDDTHHSLAYTNIAEGLVHSKDDILYIPYDNKIAKNNNGSWTDVALTLPSHFYITSICEYGDFLAIACAPLNGIGGSRVFLWNRDETLTTLSENIDWGEGTLKMLHAISGQLIGISLYGANSTRFKDRLVFKMYDGSGAKEFSVLEGGTVTQLIGAKQLIDNRLWFMMALELNGSVRWGTWSVGRKYDGSWAIIHERTPENDTAFSVGNTILKGFIKIGDYLIQSYTNTSGDYALSKTNDQASYTATAIWESKINPGIPDIEKTRLIKLKAVGAIYDALPTAGQIVVKHRIQGGTYKTVFTETTNSTAFTQPVTLYADGTAFESRAREHEFRIESTGGAAVSGLILTIDDET